MGKKIFISYKYSDSNVYPLKSLLAEYGDPTKVRDYVTLLQNLLGKTDHVNKGEDDDESLTDFREDTIASKLRNKIYDSSVTIVMISPQMKESSVPESDQWIPWEISYSLREKTREGRTSGCNAILSIVLPDQNGAYNYFLDERQCCAAGCRIYKIETLFGILKNNMFSRKDMNGQNCGTGQTIFRGEFSYILCAKWDEFTANHNLFINRSISINDQIADYNITKMVD